MRKIALIEGNFIELDDNTVVELDKYYYYGEQLDFPTNEQVKGLKCELIIEKQNVIALYTEGLGHFVGRIQ